MSEQSFDVLVVGAGPAGLAAALSAARTGAGVGVIDDNPHAGGQIWRGAEHEPAASPARRWLAAASQPANLTLLPRTRVIAAPRRGRLLVEDPDQARELAYERLILATGARERFLPFPGWTLPGVLGAGGLQALAKGGLPIAGKRIVVAGSGPLLLAVAAYLQGQGAEVPLIVEQTSRRKLAAFLLSLARLPEKSLQAAALRWTLRHIPLRVNSWVSRAHGSERLTAVTVQEGARSRSIACDYLACGFGLAPNLELPSLLGCAQEAGAVAVDSWQETSIAGVYAAGEVTGIGGVELALAEGEIAGLAATGQWGAAQPLSVRRRRLQAFAAALERAFALREELRTLADPETIVCRCEDVPYAALQGYASWRSAKLQARCGMGPCQGRVCGAAAAFLFGWPQETPRPPLTAARLASLVQPGASDSYTEEIKQ